jgi:hypothetical protein
MLQLTQEILNQSPDCIEALVDLVKKLDVAKQLPPRRAYLPGVRMDYLQKLCHRSYPQSGSGH